MTPQYRKLNYCYYLLLLLLVLLSSSSLLLLLLLLLLGYTFMCWQYHIGDSGHFCYLLASILKTGTEICMWTN
jgi:hypothetical protein